MDAKNDNGFKTLTVKEFLEEAEALYLPYVSIQQVIFSYNHDELNVLLLNFDNSDIYCLPGGYVKKKETLDDAAKRSLYERTSIKDIFLQQFRTYGDLFREEDNLFASLLTRIGGELPQNNFITQRKISVCYYSLVDETKVVPHNTDLHVKGYKWANINDLPKLFTQHHEIIFAALAQMRNDIGQKNVASHLMNETFTMNELQKLYEIIFQKSFDRGNFQRRMLSLDVLERLEKQYDGSSHKAPYLYRFKD
jgi:8-oxo-dGTP diphosphatase